MSPLAVTILAASGVSGIVAWGPLVVAVGGLVTAVVTMLARRDTRQNQDTMALDSRTNTALKGLEAYADRLDKERRAWQVRAEAAEAKVEALEAELADRPPTPRRRSRPRDD